MAIEWKSDLFKGHESELELSDELEARLDALDGFMRWSVAYDSWVTFEDGMGEFFTVEEGYAPDSKDCEVGEPEHGWCARLSAPGYMDCTEWCGPFDTVEEAAEALLDMFEE